MSPPSKLPFPVRLAALAVAGGAAVATIGLLLRNREGLVRNPTDLTRERLSLRKDPTLPELNVEELLSRAAEVLRASHPCRTLKLEGSPVRGSGHAAELLEAFARLVGAALDNGHPVTAHLPRMSTLSEA